MSKRQAWGVAICFALLIFMATGILTIPPLLTALIAGIGLALIIW